MPTQPFTPKSLVRYINENHGGDYSKAVFQYFPNAKGKCQVWLYRTDKETGIVVDECFSPSVLASDLGFSRGEMTTKNTLVLL